VPILAHAGHWAIYGLYGAPIVVVLTSIVVAAVRDRRERDRG
jgi:hypothetical protein